MPPGVVSFVPENKNNLKTGDMKKTMKVAVTMVAICLASVSVKAQDGAYDAFRTGDYDRAAVLSQRQIVEADILREKAVKCSRLSIEMNAFLSIGQDEAAKAKASEILILNPEDEAAWAVLRVEQVDTIEYDDLRVDMDAFGSLQLLDTEVDLSEYGEVEVVEEEVEEEAIPFELVEQKPSFNGGDANQFAEWVNSKLVYPKFAKENGVQGRVILQFTVEADGRVTNVKVLRSVDESLDREAVRVVSSSPKWKPGKQRDRAVKVTYTFPVIFQLR